MALAGPNIVVPTSAAINQVPTDATKPSGEPKWKALLGSAWSSFFGLAANLLWDMTRSGPTVLRPTSEIQNRWVGMPYFDTDLQQVVWLASVNPDVWVTGKGVSNGLIFTSNDTWTCPNGVTAAHVIVVGAGGGGGGGTFNRGGGGGGGGEVHIRELIVSPGTTYTVTIGAAGTGGASGVAGGDGGDTSFSPLITATGGGGGGSSSGSANGVGGNGAPSNLTANGGTASGGAGGAGAVGPFGNFGSGGGGGSNVLGGGGIGGSIGGSGFAVATGNYAGSGAADLDYLGSSYGGGGDGGSGVAAGKDGTGGLCIITWIG
jgi:hypothetical protein